MFQQSTINSDQSSAKKEIFLDILVSSGLIKKEDLHHLKLKSSELEIVEYLLNSGVDKESLYRAYSKYSGVPFVVINNIEPSVSEVIDVDAAKSLGFIPFSYDKSMKVLQVAFHDISRLLKLNQEAISQLEKKLDLKIEIFLTSLDASIKKDEKEEQEDAGQLSKENKVNLSEFTTTLPVYKKMPLDLAKKFKAVIFSKTGDNEYRMATVKPDDPKLKELVNFVKNNSGIQLEVVQATKEDVESAIGKYEELLKNDLKKSTDTKDVEVEKNQVDEDKNKISTTKKNEVNNLEDSDLVQFLSKKTINIDDLKQFTQSQMIPQLVAGMIMMAVIEKASDVHIEPFEKVIRVRFRIDGELSDVILLPSSMTNNIVARIKILSKLKLDEQRIPQDGRFDVTVGDYIVDIRVSTLPTVFGEKIVLRLLSKNKEMEKLEDLGIEGLSYDRIIEAISKPYGVILATGPTGSGKSTSLYSILTRLNKPQINIITLEDPVEYELQGINQVQVKPQIGFGFAEGLRSVLRQDPNIIMVGEIRDSDTAELVTHAALTGHLVLSTLHTNNASGALPRLFNLKVEPFLLTSAINAVIAQRLVRKICPKCRQEMEPPQSVVFEVKKEMEKISLNMPLKFYKGAGCSECNNGFSGRVGIFEVLTMNSEIEDLVLNEKTADDIYKSAVNSGMITLRQDGFIKVLKGVTTIDEVLRVTGQK